MDISDEAIAAARKASKTLGPRVVSARYLRASEKLEVGYENQVILRVPVGLIQDLASRDTAPSATELSSIEIWGDGYDLHFPRLDAFVHGPALLKGILGTQSWVREHARGLGSSTSAKKAAAARRNGLKGGRPKKQATLA